MAKKNQLADGTTAAEAIDRVLSAETQAREAMQECRQEADQIVEAAREDARRILRKANQRAGAVNEKCDRLISEKSEALRAKAHQDRKSDELDDNDQARLTEAVNRVAEKLTRIDL